MKPLMFIALLVFFLNFSESSAFDFYALVQQWPPAVCVTPKSCSPTDFVIHGLWPSRENGSHPEYCDRSRPFEKKRIADLINELQKEWPTMPALSCPTDDEFWSYQWRKHGTCSDKDIHDYFEAALKLKKKANILPILTRAGITPNDQFYDLNRIVQAIKGGFGFTPIIVCKSNSKKQIQLHEIYLCVARDAKKLEECPASLTGRQCSAAMIKFPK